MDQDAVVAAVSGLPARAFNATTVRHVAIGYAPMSGEGARITGGRWNPPDSFAVLYMALSGDTATAEFRRFAAKQGLTTDDFLPRDLFSYEVRLSRVLDLRETEARSETGLSSEVDSDDVDQSQAIGDAAHLVGFEAILAPSATGVGDILAVFLDRLLPESSVRDVNSVRWSVPGDL